MAVTKVQVLNEDGVTYTTEDIGALAVNVYLSDEETNVESALNDKVSKVQGKDLSTNDYTTAEKNKLNNIEAEAQKNVQSDWDQADSSADDYIKNKPTILSTNEAFGQGYGTCSTAADATAKVGVLANYDLKQGGIVAIRFVNDVIANSTLNINSKGAKPIYYRNLPIASNVVSAGDLVTFMYDGTYYRIVSIDRGGSSGAGHNIVDTDGVVMAQRDNLQFDGLNVEDSPSENKTIIHGQLKVCETKAEWDAMSDEEKNDPNIYWERPWADADIFATDKTPIGTVISVTGDYDSIVADADNNGYPYFPTKDYIICDGSVVAKIDEYSKLYNHFASVYGDGNYFGSSSTPSGYFGIPDFSADFPTNGVLAIKAQMSSDKVTIITDIDDEIITPDNLWSAEKIYDFVYHTFRRERKQLSKADLVNLPQAVAEQNLAKYGYAIGDYFESPEVRTLKAQSGTASTESSVNVKLVYHLADLNTYYGGYNNNAVVSTPHIGIVVDTKVNRQWHTGDASTVGYNGSTLQAFLQGEGQGQVMTAIKADMLALFGKVNDSDTGLGHLLAHNKLFTTKLDTWAWQNNKYISALTESETFGHPEWSVNGFQEGEAVKPLELFQKFRWNEIFGNMWIWLRNLYAASRACTAAASGIADYNGVVSAERAMGLILFH